MDFYRLQDSTEVEDLGFEEYFYLSGLTVIEWAKRADELLPESSLCLYIEITDQDSRKVTCSFVEELWRKRLEQILHEAGFTIENMEI
jgi:tRNA threonylcarbamoyladenosine biosynthesis protein TsaE